MKALSSVALVMLLAGCTSTSSSTSTAVDKNQKAAAQETANNGSAEGRDKLICENIKPTGSHRLQRVCRTAEQVKRDREESQEMLRRVSGTGMKSVEGT